MATKLNRIRSLFKAKHDDYLRAVERSRAEIERQHAQQLAAHRKYAHGSASIAFLENADSIFTIHLEASKADMLKARDEAITYLREAMKAEAEAIRAGQAEKRHRMRVKIAPAIPTDKAAAMQAALSVARTYADIERLHADALAANDQAAAYWLETNAGARIEQVGKASDLIGWDGIRERERQRRGGALLREIEATNDEIRSAEAEAGRYRTTDEARQLVSKWGGSLDDWLTLTE